MSTFFFGLRLAFALWLCASAMSPVAHAARPLCPPYPAPAAPWVRDAVGPDQIRHYHRQSLKPVQWAWWSDAHSALVGTLERRTWRQWMRTHILFRDLHQELQAEGTQPVKSAFRSRGLARLHIKDAEGKPLVNVQGLSHDAKPLRFRLTDKDHRPLGDAWIDAPQREIRFTLADRSFLTFAIVTREEQNPHHWELAVFDHDVVPELAWPVLVDFFTDARYTQ